MAFLRKKKVKFSVELVVQKITDVPLLNAMIFAKVRLLDCGSFVGVTLHRPVCSHQVDFMGPSISTQFSSVPPHIRLRNRTISGQCHPCGNVHRHSTTDIVDEVSQFTFSTNALQNQQSTSQCQLERRHSLTERSPREYFDAEADFLTAGALVTTNDEIMQQPQFENDEFIDEHGNATQEKNTQPFVFVCYIPYDSKYTGELEVCRCKISVRKEDRAGRNPQKLGFVILNLSEFAGSGTNGVSQSFLLDGYGSSQRQDNSRVHVHIRMQHNSSDPMFKVPQSASIMFQHQNGTDEQNDQLGQWLSPLDRRAPPPSSNVPVVGSANSSAGSSGNGTLVTCSSVPNDALSSSLSQIAGVTAIMNPVHHSVGAGSLLSSSTNLSTVATTLSSSSTFPTVPGGFGHNMSMRVQRTRRDPCDVIDEVLAENCATINAPNQPSSNDSSDDQYESS